MENKPLLSICIPTYNREKYLKECLDSVINQEWFNEEEIEIVISDNASTDNTKQLVATYIKKHTNIIYHRNDINIWPLKNFIKLPDYAHWEYIWYLSDDDMLSDIGLKTTLEVIKKENPWLILSKYFWFTDGDSINLKKINKKWQIITIIWIEKFFDFLSTINYSINWYMIAISLFCFKKEIYKKNLNTILKKNWKKYINILEKDYFPHSRIIFLPFWNTEKITIIEKDLVYIRGENISWSFKFDVCRDLLRLFKDLNKAYKISKKTYRKMENMYFYCIFTYVIINHVRKILPKKIYDTLVNVWRKLIKLMKIW